MKKILLISVACVLSLLGSTARASVLRIETPETASQQILLRGTIVDAAGAPIIGAGIVVKGTTNGTVTNGDGTFTLPNVPIGSVLQISCIGYDDQEVVFNGQQLNITLSENAELLEDAVVTALGIRKERKALGYSVSEVNAGELMKNKNTNVVNSLVGKVPGVNVTQSSGAAGSGATIIIRGANSTAEGRENQPLFVVDGIIYDNSTTVTGNSAYDGATRNMTTFSNRVMDINPEDIESLSVLKGAAAAALYGSRAADGAIIITTKKGLEGAVRVDFASKTSVSFPNKLPKVQRRFGRGWYEQNGVLTDLTYDSWGEPIPSGTPVYDNIGNFFNNGVVYDNNVSVSGGSKNGTFFLSASNFDQTGIVPNTGYAKTTVRFNGEQKYGRLTVGANVAYSVAKTDKTLTSGGLWDSGGTGSMNALYSWPLTEDMSHYLNEDGSKYRLFDGVWMLADDKENPYWIINKDNLNDQTNRFTGSLNASFRLTDWWDISGRFGYDDYTTDSYTYIAPGSVVKEIYQKGRLNKSDYRYNYMSTNLMSNMHKTFGDFELGLLVGTASEDTKRINQIHYGYNFVTAGTISFTNIADTDQFFREATVRKRLVGVFGEFRASWNNIAYLTVTGRNDWSSTLPVENRSYFYPSVSGSVVFTELIPKNPTLTFGKIRASWAEVGKDANAYATNTYLVNPIQYGSFTGVGNNYVKGNSFLKPEIQDAWEVGTELKFWNGRVGLDYTYYHSETRNQIASPRLSNANGSIMTSINSGSVINDGMEVAMNFIPVSTRDFSWDITLNWSYNRGRLGEFLEGVGMFYPTDAQFGTIRAASIPNGGHFLGIVGTRYAREKVQTSTDAAGKPVFTETEYGKGRYIIDKTTGLYKISPESNTYLGDREPRFIGGLANTFRWKDLTFSFLLDFRKGGLVYNGTEHMMVGAGLSELTTAADRKSVTVTGLVDNGTKEVPDYEEASFTYEAGKSYDINGVNYSGEAMIQNYWSNYASNSYNFLTDVNWLKLRSLSLTYDFTNLIKRQHIIKRLSASLIGTNLLTFTNYKGMDPEVSTAGGTGGSGATGIDYCSVPAVAGVSIGVNLTF